MWQFRNGEGKMYMFHHGQRVSKSLSGWQFKLGNSKLDWPKTPQPDRIIVRPWELFLSFRYAMRGRKEKASEVTTMMLFFCKFFALIFCVDVRYWADLTKVRGVSRV